MIIDNDFYMNDKIEMSELDEQAYKLYRKDNRHHDLIAGEEWFIKNKDTNAHYKKYYKNAIILLRHKKLKKIEQKNKSNM